MYFPFFKLKKWGKKTAEARRHNCAVLPYICACSGRSHRSSRLPSRTETSASCPVK